MPHTALRSFVLDPHEPLPEGSCVFMENTIPLVGRLVEKVTGSPLSHVAILLHDPTDGYEPKVYEAYPPVVRKTPWDKYVNDVLPKWADKRWTKRLGGLNQFWWIPPEHTFGDFELVVMREKAEALLGTPYSLIWHWLFPDSPHIHCSDFVSRPFEAAGFFESDGGRETPGSLYRKVLKI